jgi:hypothetical protein
LHNKPVTFLDGNTAADFGYILYWDDQQPESILVPVSEVFTGSPEVKISDNSLTIKLDRPNEEFMFVLNDSFSDGITISPDNVNCWFTELFHDMESLYSLTCKNSNSIASLIYVDKGVTINGTVVDEDDGFTFIDNYNVSLNQGWNFLIRRYSEQDNTLTNTYTATRILTSGFEWTVTEH